MKQLHSEVLIEASPTEVWTVLTDFARYADWNPFVVNVTGTPEVGERLSVTLSPPGGRRITLKPEVTEIVEWTGPGVVGAPRGPGHS